VVLKSKMAFFMDLSISAFNYLALLLLMIDS